MLIKFRPVKGDSIDEIKESHIHMSFYDDTLHHVSGHYLESEKDELQESTHEIASRLEAYIKANLEHQKSFEYDDDETIRTKGAIKSEARRALYEAVKACPFKILVDTSLFLVLEDEKDLEDEWNFDLCQGISKSAEFDTWASKASNDGYLSGHLM